MIKHTFVAITLLLCLSTKMSALEVEFITPSIVRVQWADNGDLKGNNTGICVYKTQNVKVKEKNEAGYRILFSTDLIVKIDKTTDAISFVDRRTGKILLKETSRITEPVVQERIIYDENTAHMEETANGMVTVKDIIRRDTMGISQR